ncbi:unnamed protein product [Moneuplotes crassus]|uniref:Uncharacterized protein n=1 Tax=Euplotes crassus TaxID=5936 RepID=A0AAD1XDA1_EUPCR|nr:unnamed protein product [Moneuplotes crassus]
MKQDQFYQGDLSPYVYKTSPRKRHAVEYTIKRGMPRKSSSVLSDIKDKDLFHSKLDYMNYSYEYRKEWAKKNCRSNNKSVIFPSTTLDLIKSKYNKDIPNADFEKLIENKLPSERSYENRSRSVMKSYSSKKSNNLFKLIEGPSCKSQSTERLAFKVSRDKFRGLQDYSFNSGASSIQIQNSKQRSAGSKMKLLLPFTKSCIMRKNEFLKKKTRETLKKISDRRFSIAFQRKMDNSEYYQNERNKFRDQVKKIYEKEIKGCEGLEARTNQFQIKLIEMHQKIVKQFKDTEKVLNFEDVMFGYNRIEN